VENFRRSGVLRRINEGAHLQAACAMELWRRATIEGHSIVVDALVRRRAAEKSLFLTPDRDAWVAAPSAIVRPDLDYDNAGNVPRETPATVTTPLEGERTRVEREPGVSPTQTAAASVTARLRNLFRGEEEPRAPAKTPLVLDAEEPFVLTPPDEDQAPIEAWPAAEPRETFATDVVTRDLFDPAEAPAEAEPLELTEALEVAPEDSRPSWPLLLVLAAVGLILFAGSLYWYFNGSGGAKPPGFSTVMVLTASLAGVAAFGASVYLMLERLGRAVGDLGEEVDG
jgi:lysozyme